MADRGKTNPNLTADYFFSLDFSKLKISLEDMFKGGVHFGHHKSRKNPCASEYIFTTRNGINIIDLERTKEKLEKAMQFLTEIVFEGQEILFVGTKKQAKSLVRSAAKACGMPYVVERWLGGTFSNFSIISTRTRYLREGLEKMKKGEYAKYTKFEQMKKAEELEGLERKMGGIKDMLKFPGAVFVTSLNEDVLAVKESKAKGIPIVALVDTNVDPAGIDYPIPANEDAVSSLRLMLSYIVKAVIAGKDKRLATEEKNNKKEEE